MSVQSVVVRVGLEMRHLGWSEDQSQKLDADGRQIARKGDATWVADMQATIETVGAQDALAELSRRDAG